MTRRGQLALFGVTVLVAAACVSLGLWQGRRLGERRAANRISLERRGLPEVDLNTAADTDSLPDRRVLARGAFDHERAFVLRGRVEREAPGVQIVTPLLLDGLDQAVLVNRGFVPAADAATPDPGAMDRSPVGTVRGLAFRVPADADSGGRLTYRGTVSWRRLDLTAARSSLPYPVLNVYVHETEPESRPEGAPRFPVPAALPPLDDGPHLAYMIQWLGIGGAALAFGIMFVLRGRAAPKEEG